MQEDFSNMTQKDWKQYEEKHIVLPMLKDLGYSEDNLEPGDRPDVKVSLGDGKKLGIEVTHYTITDNKRIIPVLHDILDGYSEHLSQITSLQYQIGVYFWGVEYPNEKHLKQYREEIYQEIDSFIPGHEQNLIHRKFIEDVIFCPSPGTPTHASEVVALEGGEVVEEVLLNKIREKETKLVKYKKDSKNNDVQQYWLVIYFATEEKTDFRKYTLPEDFQTTYDRIFLVSLYEWQELA